MIRSIFICHDSQIQSRLIIINRVSPNINRSNDIQELYRKYRFESLPDAGIINKQSRMTAQNASTGFINTNINNEHFFILSDGAEKNYLRITPFEYVLEN